VRENMTVTTVAASAWKDVRTVKSSAVFADAVTGHVGNQITNVASNSVEGAGSRTCVSSVGAAVSHHRRRARHRGGLPSISVHE
jgi:hypothetical protein